MLVADPGVIVTEHLRYMGAVRVFDANHPGSFLDRSIRDEFKMNSNEALITVDSPDPHEGHQWAKAQMERLESFDVAAVWYTIKPNGLITTYERTQACSALFTNRLVEELC
jgi:hypothetical protein